MLRSTRFIRLVLAAVFVVGPMATTAFSLSSAPANGIGRSSGGGGGGDNTSSNKFVILGGTGKIGTAVASHLLQRSPSSRIVLVGRNKEKGEAAVQEVLSEHLDNVDSNRCPSVEWAYVDTVWKQDNELLMGLLNDADCLIHTAGPYLGEEPFPLELAIAARCKAYVDVSDPLEYLEASLELNDKARLAGTSALLSSGAFPGLSNVLATEASSNLPKGTTVKDVRFNYFTAGLGGSGDVNLYITNLGFGEPMAQFEQGKLRMFQALSGLLLGKVSFFLDQEFDGFGFGNGVARQRLGTKTVFSWPFPEAATVPRELGAVGDSHAAMGTAPDIWNDMLGILVTIVPRPWWRSERFSQFLADFSQPLVKFTDELLRLTSPDKVGETHAMRVDVVGMDGTAVSVVQAHESFRRCVGQSCAEFALDLLEHPSPGVSLPEQRYGDASARKRMVKRLTSTSGTFAYTGPVTVKGTPKPTDLDGAIERAVAAETAQG